MHITISRLSALLTTLLFVGAGCVPAADKVVDDALRPVTVPFEALEKAGDLSAEQRARANEENERMTNEVGVVMILTEGAEAPTGVLPGEVIGCNDRPVVVQMTRETATGNTMLDALATLFAVRDSNVGGLHNSLAYSELAVDDIRSPDGITTEVRITGNIVSGGACDDPRIKEQIEGTIRRFKPTFRVLLNGSESAWRCHGDMSGECN